MNAKISSCICFILFANILSGVYAYTSPPINVTPTNPPIIIPPPPSCESCSTCADSTEPSNPAAISFDQGFGRAPWLGIDAPGGKLNIYIPNQGGGGSMGGDAIGTRGMFTYNHPAESKVVRRDAANNEVTVRNPMGFETTYGAGGKPVKTMLSLDKQCTTKVNGEVVELLENRTRIIYGADNAPVRIVTPSGVEAQISDFGVEVLKDLGGIRQIWSKADGLLDFTEPTTNSVLVSWYPTSGTSTSKDPATGLYTFSGNPVKTFLFTRTTQQGRRLVSGPGCPACASGKVVYHIQACNSIYETIAGTYNGLVLAERRGSDFLFRYEWQYLGSPNSWSLTKGEGAETVTDSVISLPNIFPGRLQQTRTVSSADGSISSVKRELLSYDNRGFISLRKSAVDATGQEQVLFQAARIDVGSNAGRISASTNAYGGSESYVYDSDGRMTRMTETLQGGITQVTTNTYSTVHDVDGFADRRPLRTVVTQNGVTISDVAYSYSSTFESVARTDSRTGVTLSSLKYLYAPDSVNPFERGRVKLTVNPDGSATHYAYAEGENGLWTETVTQGYWCPAFFPPGQTYMPPADITQLFSVLPNKSTRTVNTHDFRGDVVRTESFVHTGAEFTLAGWETYTYNIMHKRLGTTRHDGTSDLSNWICTGPVWQRNADGTSVTNTFDTAKRIKTSTSYTPFGNVAKTYTYDADNRVISRSTATNGVTVGCGVGCGSSYSEFDTQGRTVLSVDAIGRTNRTSYSLDNRTVTRTDPAGAVVVENYATDGSLLSRTGTVMRAEYHTQGVDSTTGTRWENTTYGSPIGPDYTKSYYNALRQLVLQERPGFGGAILKTVYAYNAKGQLESESRVVQGGTGTYDLPVTTYAYNQLGASIATTQAVANVYRVQSSDSAFIYEDGIVQQTSVSVQSCSDLTIPAMTNASITRLYPLENGLLAESRMRDVRGNETVQKIVQDPATYVQTTTVSNAISVLPAISISLAGLTLSQTDQHGCTTTYGYDALMRQISAESHSGPNNERLTGSYTHFNVIGQVDYIEDVFGSRTVYGYEPGTGRNISTTQVPPPSSLLPPTSVQTAFDQAGRTVATWGATYPVAYEYDNASRMIAMYTYRGTNAIASYLDIAALKPEMDRTQWLYDQATGLLTNKLYADGKGPSYSYTALGQLSTRKWARLDSTGQQLLTLYSYNNFGSLTNTAYSDGTPSISFTFNALGQINSIADASGTRTLDYAVDSQLIAEHLAFGTSLFTLQEKFDILARNVGYALSNGVVQITSSMQNFDQYGRLNQVAVEGISGVFNYGYLEGSHLQKTLVMPNGVIRTLGYETNRDLLTLIVHSNATERLVKRDFTFDGLARLQNRTLFRGNETPVQPDAFAYNSRSELTNAIYSITQSGTNAIRQFSYDFDPIGNRNSAIEFGTNTTYTASALNQYTSINPVNPVENFNPEFDLDGNQTLLKTATGIWHVTYNAENRPVLFSNDTAVVEMAYDYMGRRCEYKEYVNNILNRHERYLYRGYLQIAALDMLNAAHVKHIIAWDPTERTATRPLSLQIGVNNYFCSFDQVKNVTELFDSTGAIAATYDYSPFGQVTSFQITPFSNPLTFSSEIHDSTLGLQYYNYRHLNLLDGRWVNRDPSGEKSGINVNVFVYNNVCNAWDSLGLSVKDTFKSWEIHTDNQDFTFNISESIIPPAVMGGTDLFTLGTGGTLSRPATVEFTCDKGCGTVKINIPGLKVPDVQCGYHLKLKKVQLVVDVWVPTLGTVVGHEMSHAKDFLLTQFNDTFKAAESAEGHCSSKKKCECLKSLYENEMPNKYYLQTVVKTHEKDKGEKNYEERHKKFVDAETAAANAFDKKVEECDKLSGEN